MTTSMNNFDLNGVPSAGEGLTAIADVSEIESVSDNGMTAMQPPSSEQMNQPDTAKPAVATPAPAELLFETEQEESSDADKDTYWKSVLTGNPATVPTEVSDRCGANDAGLSPEQREYRLCSTINRSWMSDHSEHSRRELMVNWGKYRAELAKELGVADDEREVFVALSVRERDADRRETHSRLPGQQRAVYDAGRNDRGVRHDGRFDDGFVDDEFVVDGRPRRF